ncbi:hypothetical protein OFR22_09480 [Brachyspira hyodysenteriae]|uniref:Uncharacterized protein n=1 Tax=Brachyspira hyodysenteriae ATCC 27164 TaxID=1266923 RepID=A0A3B6VQT5_BRAHO|nr:hypothetical protein [Brachyspira hyodysenteriae]ANN63180.1 hypothetical protein BHYOB78_04690 [Brachyspira hyodysenteriae ATCC 27164]KLI16742.1 hypothetical protein SU44_05115 [Brachyspira hyodysenteriae]KLI22046.1 hypothetical protein SU46_00705 [Brachyspira hyodysenteriae]KLI24738.1 hypothetical protein SZ47_07210 [Brachyspira hyodysenteriae]KLI25997.1 hypothetical protein SU43_02180 [Brachyspira hyodysenteriae]
MRVIRFIVFACFLVIFIVIANIIHKNINSYEVVNIKNPFTYYNLIAYSNNDIKSLASLSFKDSFESLADMFDVERAFVVNNILKKDIKIREDDAELIVFTGSNSISQITVNSYDNVENLFENVFESLTSNNIQLEKQSLDDEEGNILAEIYTHKTDTYKLIITKTYMSNASNLSIDYVNLSSL